MKNYDNLRNLFPALEKRTFLDHAALSPLSTRVEKAISEVITDYRDYGVQRWEKWNDAVQGTREKAAHFLNCSPNELAFTTNTTDSMLFVVEGLDWKPGDNIVSVENEFVANYYPWMSLHQEGVELKLAPQKNGRINLDDIENLINERTRLLTVSWVQYSNGYRVDLEILSKFCKKKNILFAVDAIQGLGALQLDLKKVHIDFMFCGGHKWLLSPVGTGIFYCRKKHISELRLRRFGWMSVEEPFDFTNKTQPLKESAQRFEYSNQNQFGLIGMGASLDLFLETGQKDIESRVLELTGYLRSKLQEKGITPVSPGESGELSGITSFTIGKNTEKLHKSLIDKKIAVSYRAGNIRVAPHFYNNEDDIDKLIESINL